MAMISALQQRSKTPRRNGNVDPAIPAQITYEARDAPVALHALRPSPLARNRRAVKSAKAPGVVSQGQDHY